MMFPFKNLNTFIKALALFSCSSVAFALPAAHHSLSSDTNVTIPITKPSDVPDAMRTLSSPMKAPINVAISPEMLSDPSQLQALKQVITKAAEQGTSVNILIPANINIYAYAASLSSLEASLQAESINVQVEANNYMEFNSEEELQNQITEINNYISSKQQSNNKTQTSKALGWVVNTAMIAVGAALIATSSFSELGHAAALAGITMISVVVISPSALDPSQKQALYNKLKQIATANGMTLSSVGFTVNPT